jgi:hypothetical protein
MDNSTIPSSIPKEVWGALIIVIEKLIYPITATTVGVGKLIEFKFKQLNEIQKIIAEKTLQDAVEKVKNSPQKDFDNVTVKPEVICVTLDNTDSQVDDNMRNLWSNLTARELSEGSIHPEIARLLAKLTKEDLVVLSDIAEKDASLPKLFITALASAYTFGVLRNKKSFHHVYLRKLGLIDDVSGKWFLTTFGRELIRSIKEL